MQITVNIEDLTKALGRVAIATHSSTLPILSSVLLQADTESLTISATDLELFIKEKIPAIVKMSGSIVVGFKLFNAFASRAASKEAKLTRRDKFLVVTHGDNEADFETLDASEFPPSFDLTKPQECQCNALELVKALASVEHSISRESERYALTGVNINSRNGGCDVVATDSRRLSVFHSELPLKDISVTLPRLAVAAIIKGLGSNGPEATLLVTQTVFCVKTASSEISARLLESSFVKYRGVIPDPVDQAFSAHREELRSVIQTASLFLREKEIAVRLSGKKKEIEVECYNRFKGRVMGAELSGQPSITKSVNYRFLLDILSVLENDTVRIEVSEGLPLVIREGNLIEVINSLTV